MRKRKGLTRAEDDCVKIQKGGFAFGKTALLYFIFYGKNCLNQSPAPLKIFPVFPLER
jgi:hypothetical protein